MKMLDEELKFYFIKSVHVLLIIHFIRRVPLLPPPFPPDTELSYTLWHMLLGKSKVLLDIVEGFVTYPYIEVVWGNSRT